MNGVPRSRQKLLSSFIAGIVLYRVTGPSFPGWGRVLIIFRNFARLIQFTTLHFYHDKEYHHYVFGSGGYAFVGLRSHKTI